MNSVIFCLKSFDMYTDDGVALWFKEMAEV